MVDNLLDDSMNKDGCPFRKMLRVIRIMMCECLSYASCEEDAAAQVLLMDVSIMDFNLSLLTARYSCVVSTLL